MQAGLSQFHHSGMGPGLRKSEALLLLRWRAMVHSVTALSVVDCRNGLINAVDPVESERPIVSESRHLVIAVYVQQRLYASCCAQVSWTMGSVDRALVEVDTRTLTAEDREAN